MVNKLAKLRQATNLSDNLQNKEGFIKSGVRLGAQVPSHHIK